MVKLLFQMRRPMVPTPLRYGCALITWAGLSHLWAIDKVAARQGLQTGAQLLALAILAVNEIGSIQRLRGLLAALFIGCAAVSVMGLLGIGTTSGDWLLSLEGQGAKEDGAYVGIAFLLSVLVFVFGPASTKPAAAGAALVSSVPLLACGERGVLLAVGLACAAVIPIARQKWKALLTPVVVIGLLYAALPLLLSRGQISHDVGNRFTVASVLETGGTGRTDIWKVGLALVKDNPWLGVGMGSFESAVGFYESRVVTKTSVGYGRGPHSDWLAVAGTLGLPGLCLFLGLLTSTGSNMLKQLRRPLAPPQHLLAVLVWGLLIYMLSLGLTSTFIWRKVYWLVLGLAMLCPRLFASDTAGQLTSPSADGRRDRRSSSRLKARRSPRTSEVLQGAEVIQPGGHDSVVKGQV